MVEPSKDLQLVFDKAIKDAQKLRHEYITLEHLLFSMMCSNNFCDALKVYGADVDYIKANLEHQVAQTIVSKTWTKRLKTYLIILPGSSLLKLEINMETTKNIYGIYFC